MRSEGTALPPAAPGVVAPGVGGELLEADPLAHLALEIQVDLGHARPHLAATERANGVAGAASDGTRLALHLGFACPHTRPQYGIAEACSAELRERLRAQV